MIAVLLLGASLLLAGCGAVTAQWPREFEVQSPGDSGAASSDSGAAASTGGTE